MSPTPLPANESARLAALQKYNILDTPPEPAFDDIARLATFACQTPIALINFVDGQRVWSKTRHNFPHLELPRELTACTHAILQNDLCIVPDALLDERFATNPLVDRPQGLRFYAGVPLLTPEGYAIGTLCVMDLVPRQLTAEQQELLRALARQVTTQLDLRRKVYEIQRESEERQAAQEKLHQSQQTLSLFVQQTFFAVVSFDTNFVITDWNPAAEQIFGFTRAEMVGHHPVGLIVAEKDAAKLEQARQKILAEKRPLRGQDENLTRAGRILICEWYTTPLVDVTGEVVGVLTVAQDITEAVQAAQAVQASEARFRTLFEASPLGICIVRQTALLYANSAAATIFGRPNGEPENVHSILDYIAPELRTAQVARIEKRARGEFVPPTFETTGQRADGTRFPLQIQTNQVMLEDGPAIIAFLSDITERKQAEEALRQSEALLRGILDSTPLMIFVKSLDGRYLLVNRQWEKQMGYTLAQVKGKTNYELLPTALADRYHGWDMALLASGKVLETEDRAVAADGEHIYSRVRSLLCDDTGLPYAIIGVGTDITERRRLEEQLHQAQKMEAIGRLAGGIAHDFNNILTTIYSACTLAHKRLPEATPVRRYIDEIQRAGERAAALTQQLLAFSRKQVVQARVLNLHELLTGMAEMLKRLVGESVQISLHLAPDLGAIRADQSQMEQVLLNLAANARDAMPTGGTLTITADNVQHTPSNPPNPQLLQPYVQLTLADSGHGMDPAMLAHIFEPFFTTKAPGKGTGLGLATVYGIVRQNGGEIQVESQLQQGTTVQILLPQVDAPPQSKGQEVDEGAVTPGVEIVLLVEDQESVRRTTGEILALNGYRVLTASNAEEALQIHAAQPDTIDLLLTDMVMPLMGGSELAARLRVRQPDLKVLYMSGHTEDEGVMRAVRDEQVTFLQKPFTLAALLQKLRAVLDV